MRSRRIFPRLEEGLAALALLGVVVIPLAEIAARNLFGTGVRGAAPIAQNLVLWVAFLGAALAAREGRLLSFGTSKLLGSGRVRAVAGTFSAAVGAGVSAILAVACLELVRVEMDLATEVTRGVPAWVAQLVMPVGMALVAIRIAWRAGDGWGPRAVAFAALLAGVAVALSWEMMEELPVWPAVAVVIVATLLGGPIFAALGGLGVVFFMADGVPPVAVPEQAYQLVVHPTLPAIPLFTLAGFLLSEGRSSGRLLRLFRALVGWFPGGTALVCALLCSFVTALTGGSGVTILAVGGLLFVALREDGYPERFSLGILTASGSLGLLFPPAIPLILFGIVAEVPIDELFLGALLPGLLLIGLVAVWGVRQGVVARIPRSQISGREFGAALWAAKWEVGLPVLVLVSIFGGLATIVEASALSVLYVFVIQCVIHRDVSVVRDLPAVFRRCLVLIGGVLLILGMAKGFAAWLTDAGIPDEALEWAQRSTESRLVFLLSLNVFLLLVGCLMDIFSATVVVVPLVVPLARHFGIDPIHLGVIFVANLELGYLTPPVGLNLFLSSYRFDRPIGTVYRSVLPFLVILGIGVILITYLPALTLWLPELLR